MGQLFKPHLCQIKPWEPVQRQELCDAAKIVIYFLEFYFRFQYLTQKFLEYGYLERLSKVTNQTKQKTEE